MMIIENTYRISPTFVSVLTREMMWGLSLEQMLLYPSLLKVSTLTIYTDLEFIIQNFMYIIFTISASHDKPLEIHWLTMPGFTITF